MRAGKIRVFKTIGDPLVRREGIATAVDDHWERNLNSPSRSSGDTSTVCRTPTATGCPLPLALGKTRNGEPPVVPVSAQELEPILKVGAPALAESRDAHGGQP